MRHPLALPDASSSPPTLASLAFLAHAAQHPFTAALRHP